MNTPVTWGDLLWLALGNIAAPFVVGFVRGVSKTWRRHSAPRNPAAERAWSELLAGRDPVPALHMPVNVDATTISEYDIADIKRRAAFTVRR